MEEMDAPARFKQLTGDSAAVMRVLEMTQVFSKRNTVSAAALKKVESDKKAAEDKLAKAEAARERVTKRVEEVVKKKDEELEAEKKRSADLEASWVPTTEEFEDAAGLRSRAELVEKIDKLKLDCVEMVEAGFSRAVEQLKLLNPELKVDNIGLSLRIMDGQLVPDSPAEDE
ncbi:uncharacterized protein LOC131659205 [Vicia villosa]|uniref:uncharacterized protein LOC131659205 n=1 Tax=Vicia villosa TaxID=3911 RepID=UPI00273B1F41|nr:uncharacterized protein LOC131659205 [Vicia villosa]